MYPPSPSAAQERIVAKDALEHPYFASLDKATVGTIPLPI